jgi:hypothetical protein
LHGERALIATRLAARKQHSIFPDLLDSHFAILEEPDPDENPIVVDVSRPVEDIVAEILRELAPQVPENRPAAVARDSTGRPANPPVKPSGPQSQPSTAAVLSPGTSIRSDLPLDIEDYALIGDCTTAALVGRNGSIDWLCWPHFDSNALFAALLGTSEHGRWRISPADPTPRFSRAYHDGTMVLETVFDTADGRVALGRAIANTARNERKIAGAFLACWSLVHGLTMLLVDGIVGSRKISDELADSLVRGMLDGLATKLPTLPSESVHALVVLILTA